MMIRRYCQCSILSTTTTNYFHYFIHYAINMKNIYQEMMMSSYCWNCLRYTSWSKTMNDEQLSLMIYIQIYYYSSHLSLNTTNNVQCIQINKWWHGTMMRSYHQQHMCGNSTTKEEQSSPTTEMHLLLSPIPSKYHTIQPIIDKVYKWMNEIRMA